MGDPLYGQVCPRSIMTSVIDGPTKPSGTPKPAGSSQVFFCCEPEWATVPTVAADTFPVDQPLWTAWTNSASSIPVSFPSNPPTPNPPTVPASSGTGRQLRGRGKSATPPDPVLSFPTEQTALTSTAMSRNRIRGHRRYRLSLHCHRHASPSTITPEPATVFTEGAYSSAVCPARLR